MDNNILKSTAHQKVFTANPAISSSANKMISALITTRNKPSVIKVTGKVRKIKIGLTKVFNNARTIATIIAVTYVSTLTPGRSFASSTTATALNNIRRISFIQKSTGICPVLQMYRFLYTN